MPLLKQKMETSARDNVNYQSGDERRACTLKKNHHRLSFGSSNHAIEKVSSSTCKRSRLFLVCESKREHKEDVSSIGSRVFHKIYPDKGSRTYELDGFFVSPTLMQYDETQSPNTNPRRPIERGDGCSQRKSLSLVVHATSSLPRQLLLACKRRGQSTLSLCLVRCRAKPLSPAGSLFLCFPIINLMVKQACCVCGCGPNLVPCGQRMAILRGGNNNFCEFYRIQVK